jgi:hypothetical protein
VAQVELDAFRKTILSAFTTFLQSSLTLTLMKPPVSLAERLTHYYRFVHTNSKLGQRTKLDLLQLRQGADEGPPAGALNGSSDSKEESENGSVSA